MNLTSPLLPLKAYQSSVDSSRRLFMQELDHLLTPLGHSIGQYYLDRIARAGERPVLGEYVPWLIGDLFGITDRKAIINTSLPWLKIYAYTVFLDDLIDRTDVRDAHALLIFSGLLLQQGLAGFFELSHNKSLKYIDEYFCQTVIASVNEIGNHRFKIKPYSHDDISSLGHKVALLKLCATSLVMNQYHTFLGDDDIKSLDSIGVGMQLLDDITDWEEDLRAGDYTYLLTSTFKNLAVEGVFRETLETSLNKTEVFLSMIMSGALEGSLGKSIHFLKTALSEARKKIENSPSVQAFENLIDATSWLKNKVSDIRLEYKIGIQPNSDESWTTYISNLSRENRMGEKLLTLRKDMKIVAQST